MDFYVYILQSTSSGRFYCGSTSDLERRIRQHNDKDYHSSKTTKRFKGPWKLTWNEKHPRRNLAMNREKQIKKRGITRFLQQNMKYYSS